MSIMKFLIIIVQVNLKCQLSTIYKMADWDTRAHTEVNRGTCQGVSAYIIIFFNLNFLCEG